MVFVSLIVACSLVTLVQGFSRPCPTTYPRSYADGKRCCKTNNQEECKGKKVAYFDKSCKCDNKPCPSSDGCQTDRFNKETNGDAYHIVKDGCDFEGFTLNFIDDKNKKIGTIKLHDDNGVDIICYEKELSEEKNILYGKARSKYDKGLIGRKSPSCDEDDEKIRLTIQRRYTADGFELDILDGNKGSRLFRFLKTKKYVGPYVNCVKRAGNGKITKGNTRIEKIKTFF